MHLSHPLGISLCQIVIDSDYMDAFSLECVKICRQKGCLCLTFTSPHLCNTSLMQDDTANQLYPVVFLVQYTFRALANDCVCLRKNIVQACPLGNPLFEFRGLAP